MFNKTMLILLFSFFQLYAFPSDKTSIILLDASGSMWGKLKNRESKIEVARKIMQKYLEKRESANPLGLGIFLEQTIILAKEITQLTRSTTKCTVVTKSHYIKIK